MVVVLVRSLAFEVPCHTCPRNIQLQKVFMLSEGRLWHSQMKVEVREVTG